MAARKPAKGLVLKAVERDLKAMGPAIAASGLAASALALADEIDSARNSATSKSMCAHELRDTLDRLRALAPATDEKDGVDDIAAQRRKRIAERARRTAAADSARP